MADDPWVGTVLAERYRIESPYYRTTKAELYRGLDLSTETQIVVHLANGEFSQNSQFTSQFEQEARRLRTLEHPALIPVLEYGRERDRLFMVCPFLPGGSLEQEIRRQWSIERTNEVVERIGEALVYLHGQEMVHRNVSADSIIFDGESRPHLSLGFGRIGRAIDPAAGRGSVYVLPEQARLNYVLDDPKVDVYAFGVVLWIMLLGQPPYADAPLDKQLIESWQRIELPDAWRAILERAISSNPERRFNSMPEFLAAWRESQDPARPSFRQRAQKKAQEGRDAAAQYLYGSQTQSDEPDAAATFITGWASTNAVTISGEQARVGSAGINLRAEPRPDAPMIGRAVGGTTLRITGQAQGNYVPVQARQEDMGAAVDLAAAPPNFVGEESANVDGDTGAAEAVRLATQTAGPQNQTTQDALFNAVNMAQGDTDTDEALRLATQAASLQDQTAQDALYNAVKGVQGDTNAAADVASYPEDPPMQQTSYGDMEQSARPQTPTMSKVPAQTSASDTPSSLPFPDVQANFRLISTPPDLLWPGQTFRFNLEVLNAGTDDWEADGPEFIWAVVATLSDARQSLPFRERLEPGQSHPLTFHLIVPSTRGNYGLNVALHLTAKRTGEEQDIATTQLAALNVIDLAQLDLDTLLTPPEPLNVAGERLRLGAIEEKLEAVDVTPEQRETVIRGHLLAALSESGSIRVQITAASSLRQLAPLSTLHGTVDDLVATFLHENAAAPVIAQSLIDSRNTSQKLKDWLQERLQASEKLSVTRDPSPVPNLQSPKPPAANGQPLTSPTQPPAAPLRPFMLALEQIAHSKPLTHKIVFDITPQRVKLTYGGENYEGPTQLDDTVLRTLALKRREYGMALFNAILHETDRQNQRLTATRNGYDFALREAREGLYLELQLDDSLHELCWENLCDPDGLPVGISDKRALYRRVRANVSKTRVDYGKLRILVMICNPPNLGPGSENTLLQNLTPINVAGEKALLEGALLRLKEAGLAEYIIYDGSPGREATLENLRDEMEKRDEEAYHILHIVAHGLFDKQKQYRLVMEGTGGKPEALVTATDFQEVLARGELRLAILTACLSATAAASEDDTDEEDAAASPDSVLVLPGLAQQLVREADIPAVIAMQGLLKADTAALFHRYFYDDLARHGRVARALAVTRGAIYDAEKKLPKSGWGIPTLFMGTDDDWLFGLDKRKVKQFDPLAPIPAEAKELLRQGNWDGLRQHIQQNMAQGLAPFAAALPPILPPTRPLAPAQNRAFLQTTLQPQVRLNPILLGAEVKKQTGLDINPMVYQQVASALNSGKHILLTGPPGTGKTSLAQAICAYAQSQQFTDDPILTTATADWTTFDTIGGYVPDTQGQLQFRPGIFLRAVRDASWLVIDEMNRAEIDKAFGELFTVLSGQAIELPYSANGQPVRVLPPAKGVEWIPSLDEAFHNVVIFPAWRIIGTMNVYDKSFLFNMSFAFMRRFAFVDVDLPPPNTYQALINRWLLPTELVDESAAAPFVALGWLLVDLVNEETVLMRRRALGPAILKDMIAYVRDRYSYEADAAALLDIFGEAFIMYALPQLDGLDHDSILAIYAHVHQLTEHLSPAMRLTILRRLKILYPHIHTAEWDNALSNRPK